MQRKTKRLNDETKVKESGRVYHRNNCRNSLRITKCNRFLAVTLFGRNGFEWGVMVAMKYSPSHVEKIIILPDRKAAVKEFKKLLKQY